MLKFSATFKTANRYSTTERINLLGRNTHLVKKALLCFNM